MTKFDLILALKGMPISLRNGEKVSQFTYFQNITEEYVLYGVVNGEIFSWTIDGYFDARRQESQLDLVMCSGYVEFEEVIVM
jgi:hypothetical protein